MKTLILTILLLLAPAVTAEITKESSYMTPFELTYRGHDYMIGIWDGPGGLLNPDEKFFALARYEGNQWLFLGTPNIISPTRIAAYDSPEAYLKSRIDQWNRYYFKGEEVDPTDDFFAEFGLFVSGHMHFTNGKLIYIE